MNDMFLLHRVMNINFHKIGINYTSPNAVSIFEIVLQIPLPIIIYRHWESFETRDKVKGWQYFRLSCYFRKRRNALIDKKYIFDMQFNWKEIKSTVREEDKICKTK